MPIKTTTVRARIEPKLKEETEHIFDELGISTTEAIRMFFTQVKLHRGLPFEIKIPNPDTEKAILEAKGRLNLRKADSSNQLFDELGI
jgi:DNA-damage-inducible protein J